MIAELVQQLDLGAALAAADELEAARRKKWPERATGTIKTSWFPRRYCFLQTRAGDAFCHQHSFIEEVTPDVPCRGHRVYFDLARDGQGRPRAENVSYTHENPVGLDDARVRPSVERARGADRALRAVGAAVLAAWDQGHHLGESDAPASVRRAVEAVQKQGIALMERAAAFGDMGLLGETFAGLADTVFSLLCALSADAPEEVYRAVDAMSLDGILRHWRRVAHLIGDARQERQQAVFRRCLDGAAAGERVWMQILGIAVWRAAELVHAIPLEMGEQICHRLPDILDRDGKDVVREHYDTGRQYLSPYVASELELCLGLLRTRESGDERIRRVLAPGGPLAHRLAEVIETIEDRVVASGIPFRTRIALNVAKPQAIRSPDLLYALRLYLTGDSGARAIQVTEVSDDE
jgi:hypothetical protein